MLRQAFLATVVLSASFLAISAMALSRASAAEPSDTTLWSGAADRIEKHRKAEVIVTVTDAAGKPIPGAKIAVEQVRHAFLFGSNIFMWGRCADEKAEVAYRQRFADLLNYATLGYYWASYEPAQGKPGHDHARQVGQWCQEHGIATKGHPLAWNYADPRWLPGDPQTILALQLARIDDCVGRFAGLIDRWDVVNEATHFDRDEFVRRAPKMTGMWKKVGQIEFTRQCFEHARQASPKATLLINDYRTDPAYAKLIEQLVDAQGKRLYDVIGIQSHMHGGPWSNQKIWETCDRFARFGVPLHFTETTILSGNKGWERKEAWPTTPEGEKRQAEDVVRFYTMLFSHPSVEAITWWDFSDYRAWQCAPAGFLRSDMSPKPVYDELLKLIKGKWWTKADVQADADGKARFRGYYGEHKLIVTSGSKRVELRISLGRGAPNVFQIRL